MKKNFRGRKIADLGFDYSRSRTNGLERRPVLISVLVSKKFSGLDLGPGLEVSGLDYNTDMFHEDAC